MARERISLVPDEVKAEVSLEGRIRSGDIHAENFNELTKEEQATVKTLLFKMASEQINPNQGTSALEFILMGFIRIMNKKVSGMAFTEDDKEIEASLQRIMQSHELTNPEIQKTDWLFDYMKYAETKSAEFLRNRKEHIERKITTTGKA